LFSSFTLVKLLFSKILTLSTFTVIPFICGCLQTYRPTVSKRCIIQWRHDVTPLMTSNYLATLGPRANSIKNRLCHCAATFTDTKNIQGLAERILNIEIKKRGSWNSNPHNRRGHLEKSNPHKRRGSSWKCYTHNRSGSSWKSNTHKLLMVAKCTSV